MRGWNATLLLNAGWPLALLSDVVRPIVLMVEQVEHLQHAVDGEAPGDSLTLRQPDIDSMDRFANQAVPRRERTVRPKPSGAGGGGRMLRRSPPQFVLKRWPEPKK